MKRVIQKKMVSKNLKKTAPKIFIAKSELSDKNIFEHLDGDVLKILNSFDEIVRSAIGLTSKQELSIPKDIRRLFHELTDERSTRKINYLNNPIKLTAYIYHYMWWNLVRISKLILNMEFDLDDNSIIADFGCGPLTLACAFWIAKPELRNKKLHWYCVDISAKALSIGYEIFNSLCSFTEDRKENPCTPWRITKVTGSFGVPLKTKIDFFVSANMFNEIFWDSSLKVEGEAKKAVKSIFHYFNLKKDLPENDIKQALIIEPGIPLAGEFIAELRRLFLEKNFSILSPCPHNCICPIPGTNKDDERYFERETFPKYQKNKKPVFARRKWCHFSFNTEDAPKRLVALSELAKLEKNRASLSFLYVKSQCDTLQSFDSKNTPVKDGKQKINVNFMVRITSDIIKLHENDIGRYACSEKGFLLLIEKNLANAKLKNYTDGSLVTIQVEKFNPFLKDKKTGAIIIHL